MLDFPGIHVYPLYLLSTKLSDFWDDIDPLPNENHLVQLFIKQGETIVTGIFISYRRRGSQGFAGRLADDLTDRFGEERVFRDVEIRPGDDFAVVIESAIASCSALLVVIGPMWLEHRNDKGDPRLDEPGDWVRLEIEAALARSTWVVPVLVGGAPMPPASALPDSIKRLSRIQAFELTDRRWDRDVGQLAAMMGSHIPGLDHPRKTEGTEGRGNRGQPADSPVRATRDIARRVLEEIGRKRRRSPYSTTLSKRIWSAVGSQMGRLVKRVISIAVLLGVAYFLIQNYGDTATKRMINDVISRIIALL